MTNLHETVLPGHIPHYVGLCYYYLFIKTTKIIIMTQLMAVNPFVLLHGTVLPDHLSFIHY